MENEPIKEFGFEIGDRGFLIEAKTEKDALLKLIEMKWDLIVEKECILLHGEVVEKTKVNSFEEPQEEEIDEESDQD